MSQLGIDLRGYLLTDATLSGYVGGARIHQNRVPEEYDGLYIWFGRSGTEDEDALDDAQGAQPFREFFDLEIIAYATEGDGGQALDNVEACADRLRTHHKRRGSLNNGSVQLLRIFDHQDDYIPRGVFGDDGLHYAAFQIEVTGYVAGD